MKRIKLSAFFPSDWPVFVVGMLLLALFVKPNSLWLDEGQTWIVLQGATFPVLLDRIEHYGNAVSGMPFFFILEFFWCKLAGLGEWGMRAINLPFGAVYLYCALRLLRRFRIPAPFALLFLLHPVFVYFMNEARPYIMLTAWGMLIVALLLCRDLNDKKTIFGFHLCFLAGLATHMMFGFVAFLYLGFALPAILKRKFAWKRQLSIAGIFALFYLPLAGFYWKVLTGDAPELSNKLGVHPLHSILEIVYSFAGFSGLGLSRNDLRGSQWGHFGIVMLAGCAALALAYLAAGLAAFRNREPVPEKRGGKSRRRLPCCSSPSRDCASGSCRITRKTTTPAPLKPSESIRTAAGICIRATGSRSSTTGSPGTSTPTWCRSTTSRSNNSTASGKSTDAKPW